MLPLKMPVAPFLALLNRDMKGANVASASPPKSPNTKGL